PDGVIEEDGMHRLAHGLVAAEREGNIRDAARYMRIRQVLLDAFAGPDEFDGVVVVLLDARRDGKDVRIEDDVFGREPHLLRQELVGAFANLELAIGRIGLSDLVESHDDGRSAVALDLARLFEELLLTFFHADRVDDRLALNALE